MIRANSAGITHWFLWYNFFTWMLNCQANLVKQVIWSFAMILVLDWTNTLRMGIKVNKEPAQDNLVKGFLAGKENNIGIPRGVVPDNLKDFHLLPWHRWESSEVLSALKRDGILKALHTSGA